MMFLSASGILQPEGLTVAIETNRDLEQMTNETDEEWKGKNITVRIIKEFIPGKRDKLRTLQKGMVS